MDGIARRVDRRWGIGLLAPVVAVALVAAFVVSTRPAHAQTQQDLVAQMLELQHQLRSLTGQVQDLQYQNRQLRDQLERAVNDLQFRMTELEGGTPQRAAPPTAAAPAEPPPAAAPPQQLGATPPQQLGAAPSGGGLQPSPGIGLGGTQAPAAAAPPPGQAAGGIDPYAASGTLGTLRLSSDPAAAAGSPMDLYNFAYARLETGDFGGAQQAFQQFLASYPADNFAPNAHFWLGETYYERRMYDEAARSYAQGYQAFPGSQVARDTLFKLGLSLAQAGRTQDACTAFNQIRADFPDTPARVMSIVDQERQRLGCG